MYLNNLSNLELIQMGKSKNKEYVDSDPFPNIYIDNVFNSEMLLKIKQEFPSIQKKDDDIVFNNPNENKLATKGEAKFGNVTKSFMHYLNSQPFLEFLQNLTGIEETLIPDPYFVGGGFHESKKNGYLKLHVDFHKHKMTKLDRRLNVLIYLNEDWKEEYNGHLDLWEKDMSKCVKRILPIFNRMAIFSTTNYSWHGLPDPILCPEDRSRQSIALYYYTNGRPKNEIITGNETRITTTFVSRPKEDSFKMRVFNNTVNTLNNILPPIVIRLIKKFRKT